MRNYQAKCVQASLTPRPTGICNFHAWTIAAIHDRLDASQVFLNLLSSFSLGSDAPCDICVRLEKEDVVQLRLIGNSFKSMTPIQWLTYHLWRDLHSAQPGVAKDSAGDSSSYDR
jgi:hypothetical protein